MKPRTLACMCLFLAAVVACGVLASRMGCNGWPGRTWAVGALNGLVGHPAAETPKPDNTPPVHAAVTATGHWTPAQTYTVADTLPVEIAIDIDGDGPPDVHATIDGNPVVFDSVSVSVRVSPPPYRAWGECACLPSGAHGGSGVSWEPIRAWGYSAGPFLAVGIPADYAAVGARVSRPLYSTVNIGFEVGYRVFRDDGLHLGASFGFAF